MTVAPVPQPRSNQNQTNYSPPGAVKGEVLTPNPVIALKQLVAGLQREQNKVQDLLSSLGFALRNLNNINQFLELTPLMVTRVTDAEGSLLFLSKGDKISLEQLHCSDDAEENFKKELKRSLAKINAVAAREAHNDLELTQSYNALDEQIKQQWGKRYQFFYSIILVKNNVQKGRLYVFSSDPDWRWTQTRRKLTQLIADQTAVAIANHELNVELSAKERQDRELEIASEIQLRLLPHKCPKICGVKLAARCKTANRVGGDYYDFIPTNYDQLVEKSDQAENYAPWSIVIGDVMGKGVPAGLIMTMTRGMLRAEVLNRHTPAEIMEHLNRVMYADLENSHRFVSMFYSEYDPKSRSLSFTNAAHNPPLWWRSNGQLEKLDSQGMLIGLDPDSHYEYNQVQLASGDIVIYYTDGFTDAVNPRGDRFEEENLQRAIRWACLHCPTPEAILEYLFDQVEKFTETANGNTDDMTLVVMQIE